MASEPGDDTTAAELALGVLDGDERASALRRVLADPQFAREVEKWRGHFDSLYAQWPEAAAPERVLARLERSLSPPQHSVAFWPGAAAALTLVAASLLIVIVLRPPSVAPVIAARPLVASLDLVSRGPAIPAVYDSAQGELHVPATALPASVQSAELWMIGSDGVPHSLGLLATAQRTVIAISPANRSKMRPGLKLAISSEPRGGSPTGLPTGPILASGALVSA
jgi:anti-sigma-K factor RskA